MLLQYEGPNEYGTAGLIGLLEQMTAFPNITLAHLFRLCPFQPGLGS